MSAVSFPQYMLLAVGNPKRLSALRVLFLSVLLYFILLFLALYFTRGCAE
jgi:hypothetical protein